MTSGRPPYHLINISIKINSVIHSKMDRQKLCKVDIKEVLVRQEISWNNKNPIVRREKACISVE